MQKTINEPAFRELAEAAAVHSVCVVGQCGGYAIAVTQGSTPRTLVSMRGAVRLFSLDNASKYLSNIGFKHFQVDASHFVPGRMRKSRPDRSVALKMTKTKPHQELLMLGDQS